MANGFKPDVGGPVPKDDAKKWIEKYDKDHRPDKNKDTKSIFFGRDILLQLLAQEGCAGISFFLASKHSEYAGKDTVNLVLVGTREDGTLMWSSDGKDGDGGTTANGGAVCPPFCPIP
jgi:hypothetical protein